MLICICLPSGRFTIVFSCLEIFSTITLITVKLGKEQIGIKEPFSVTNCHLHHKDKELLALRNNFRAAKKFLIAKFDSSFNTNQYKKYHRFERSKIRATVFLK